MTEPQEDRHDIELPDRVIMTFCRIPAGNFRMGSRYGAPDEQPVHRVEIRDEFWLAETPVTQQQYALFDPNHRNEFPGEPNHPVEAVTWHGARDFCHWLTPFLKGTKLDSLFPNLPTEAQWEYACRAGTETDYHAGDGEHALMRAGWYGEDWGAGSTHPVRQNAQNAFGLFDMHGNVWEWCRDLWSDTAYRHRPDGFNGYMTVQGAGDNKGDGARVFRGGSWYNRPWNCRSACRVGGLPGLRSLNLGFRVGLFPGPSCQGPEAE